MLSTHVNYNDPNFIPNWSNTKFKLFIQEQTNLFIYGELDENNANLLTELLQGRGDTKLEKVSNHSLKANDINAKNPFQVIISEEKLEGFEAQEYQKFLVLNSANFEVSLKELLINEEIIISDFKSKDASKIIKKLISGILSTDIIIEDNYFFHGNRENPISTKFLENLLEQINSNNPTLKVRILIIYNSQDSIDEKEISTSIKSIKDKYNEQFTIKFSDCCNSKEIKFHDRFILLNYRLIKIGGSLNALYSNRNEHTTVDLFNLTEISNQKRYYNALKTCKEYTEKNKVATNIQLLNALEYISFQA